MISKQIFHSDEGLAVFNLHDGGICDLTHNLLNTHSIGCCMGADGQHHLMVQLGLETEMPNQPIPAPK